MKRKEVILVLGLLSFLLLVISLSLLLADRFHTSSCGCPNVISNNFVYIFVILAVIFVSCLSYYLFSIKIESKECTINKNTEILMNILDESEKKILSHIIKNGGEIEQSKLSELFGKLKAHRIVKKLDQKGMIEIIKTGKSNKIKLKKDLNIGAIK